MNTIPNAERAKVLIEALPYIRSYNGKILVVKYGGNAMINEELKRAVMGDIVLLRLIGVKVVLVHGGGPEISETLTALGKKSEFIDGLRVTDAETVGVVQMTRKFTEPVAPTAASFSAPRYRPTIAVSTKL